jgi:hypothetical protein
VGNPDADAQNALLDYEQRAQVSDGNRGDVTLLPTVVVNEAGWVYFACTISTTCFWTRT